MEELDDFLVGNGVIKGTDQRRILIEVAIVHTSADMGNLGRYLQGDGAYSRLAEARWTEIQQQVRALVVTWSEVRVYQDGLPDAEPEIVQKILTEVQSANYDLLRWLVTQGSQVIGTESPLLMKEEYEHLQSVLTAKDVAAQAEARQSYGARAGALLAERDAYIARRIAETLPPGGIGLLFVGQAHCVSKHLPSDFMVWKISCEPAELKPPKEPGAAAY
ncbi:MAG: hypothetical protein EPO21_15355 [Chloroflexota bacterium]|nr:MAG: hypothetical protein EPO21_15355 [Chloroflexota bacterium]